MNLARRLGYSLLFVVTAALSGTAGFAAETQDIGLTASGTRIDALIVEARAKSAPVVVLVGGLHGDDASAAAVRDAVAAYEKRRARPVQLVGIPVANPNAVALQFPATGAAYRENVESNVLWRWIGAHAPDLVLIAGKDDAGLAAALGSQKVADMGSIPARAWNGSLDELPDRSRSPKPAPSSSAAALARRASSRRVSRNSTDSSSMRTSTRKPWRSSRACGSAKSTRCARSSNRTSTAARKASPSVPARA